MACSLSGERILARAYREKTHTILLLWNKKMDGRWQTFLISRVHDKLLLMSDAEAIFVKSVRIERKKLFFFCLKYNKLYSQLNI